MLSFPVIAATHPRLFTLFAPSFEGSLDRPCSALWERPRPGRNGLASLQPASPVFLPADHCSPIIEAPTQSLSEDPGSAGTAHYCFKSFSCNTYGPPRKCCKQKTYAPPKPFRCNTYKKHGGGGAMVPPGRTSIPVRCRELSPLFATLTKTAGCVSKIPILEGRVLPTFKRSTFKPSNDPLVPLQPNSLGATMSNGARILHHPGKHLRSPRCLRLRERTSGAVHRRSRSQVVPGSGVLMRVSGFVLTNPEQAGFRVCKYKP